MPQGDQAHYMDDYSYEDFQNQRREIESETRSVCLISDLMSVEDGMSGWNDHLDTVKQMVQKLSSRYGHMRLVRGDGNCFFRCWSMGLLEYLQSLHHSEDDRNRECDRVVAIVETAKSTLQSFGLDVFLIEDFFDTFSDVVKGIKNGSISDVDQLKELLTDESTMLGESIVTAMRFICSAHLRKNADSFAPFLEPLTVEEYCQKQVEVSNHESDQLCITAMAGEFGIGVEIEYVDSNGANQHRIRFPDAESVTTQIHMLFRPGHYDILYLKK